MSEKPIIFSTPMVQAILDGRKTQTRRVVKPRPSPDSLVEHEIIHHYKQPYCKGDVLWVRETWAKIYTLPLIDNGRAMVLTERFIYKATDKLPIGYKWRPSIHMPRAAARIFLRVTDVRVERLQEITIGDCMKEGYPETLKKGRKNIASMGEYRPYAKSWYQGLWNDINAKRGFGWESNPWVWKISFERVEA